jgi:hypothetical protein
MVHQLLLFAVGSREEDEHVGRLEVAVRQPVEIRQRLVQWPVVVDDECSGVVVQWRAGGVLWPPSSSARVVVVVVWLSSATP